MTYGYQQGGSVGDHKQALGFDAGASERLRMEAALKERKRLEKERAKNQLADIQRKYEHNKTEISHKEIEARRLAAEASHGTHDIEGAEREIKNLEDREHSSKVKAVELGVQIQNNLKEEVLKKKDNEQIGKNLEHVEKQITLLQQQATEYKRQMSDLTLLLQKYALDIKKIEAEASKIQSDAERAKSERLYKIKDLDNKKREIQALEQKRINQIGEVERMKEENMQLESQIKRLEGIIGSQ
jgi:chromosome segregation ATPase